MAVNKVIYGNQTLIDLTQDTVEADKLLEGFTAHKADGTQIVGTATGGGGGGKQLVLYERGTSHLGEVQKSSMSTYLATFGNDGITYNQYSTASSDFITKIPIDITDWDVLRVYGALAGNETSDTYKRYLVADLKSARMAAGKNEVYFTLQRTGNNFYAYLSPSTAPSVYTNGACVFSGSNYVKIFKIWLEKFDETVVSPFSITVEASEGSVITCTKDSRVLSKTVDSSEQVVFDIPETGDWVVSDGNRSKTFNFPFTDYIYTFKEVALYNEGEFGVPFDNSNNYSQPTGTRATSAHFATNYIYLQPNTNAASRYVVCGTQDKVDFTPYSKLYIQYSHNDNTNRYEKEWDISSISGSYYLKILLYNSTQTNQIFSVGMVDSKASAIPSGRANVLSSLKAGALTQGRIYKLILS